MKYTLYTLFAVLALIGLISGTAYAEGGEKRTPAAPYTEMEPAAGDPTRAITLESRDVEMVQKNLLDRGYAAGPVDGIMGPKTARALRDFQKENDLAETGTPTPETLTELGMRIKPRTSPGQSRQKMQEQERQQEMNRQQDRQDRY